MLSSRLCLRAGARPSIAIAAQVRRRSPIARHAQRIFVTTPRHRKDAQRIQTVQQEAVLEKKQAEESIKPENTVSETAAEPASKTDPLLQEQTVTNKEQRKADWAIIRDMAHYLWPKDDFGTRFRVGLSVGLLIGAKVCKLPPICFLNVFVDRYLRRFSMYKYPSTSSPSSTA